MSGVGKKIARAGLGVSRNTTTRQGPSHHRNPRGLLLLVAHMVRRGRRWPAAVVVTAGALFGDPDRLLLAHMVGDFGFRSTLIVMAILFSVGSGLRHRGQRDER